MAWQNSSPPSGKSEGKRQGTVEIGPFTKIPCKFFGSGTAEAFAPRLLFYSLPFANTQTESAATHSRLRTGRLPPKLGLEPEQSVMPEIGLSREG